MSKFCPVCGTDNLEDVFLTHKGSCITSDFKIFDDAQIDNKICRTCGLIFNQFGPREATDNFYSSSYNLMTQSNNTRVQSFSEGKGRSQALVTYDIFKDMVELNEVGAILEAGAGKGEFLSYFVKDFPSWKINAFEPSQSYPYLKSTISGNVQQCNYESYKVDQLSAIDVVVALGVLEHVNNPLGMIRWANNILSLGGYFFIRVPNFSKNPNDLFCADHLSKLTVPTIRSLAIASGFEVLEVEERGVPVFVCLKKVSNKFDMPESVYQENIEIAQNNSSVAETGIKAIVAAREAVVAAGGKLGIFGLGASGLFAPFYGDFDVNEVEVFIDENTTMWGNAVLGRPVVGLDGIEEYGITHIALAVSPVYHDQIIKKLERFQVQIIQY